MFKTLWRLLVVVVFILLIKNTFTSQTQAYIIWPENSNFVEQVKFQMNRLQENAQDLPANVEMEIKRLWKDLKPGNDAKLV
ncbi:hypothetical protein [Desulfitobacterium metallireducens]|uniref:Uncharacterized protein n=1 Tax=Desulfitobacterium metallireducens DSM 15288 TaxID=871968 RepID=W0ECC6_9FIRM|nr:hypothetical protein [Desulfitobacterium metallireducens]AHF06706.1 hypothetical protein DESME_06270 [Desulfitobacterium metallireducens DSM 15288]